MDAERLIKEVTVRLRHKGLLSPEVRTLGPVLTAVLEGVAAAFTEQEEKIVNDAISTLDQVGAQYYDHDAEHYADASDLLTGN